MARHMYIRYVLMYSLYAPYRSQTESCVLLGHNVGNSNFLLTVADWSELYPSGLPKRKTTLTRVFMLLLTRRWMINECFFQVPHWCLYSEEDLWYPQQQWIQVLKWLKSPLSYPAQTESKYLSYSPSHSNDLNHHWDIYLKQNLI